MFKLLLICFIAAAALVVAYLAARAAYKILKVKFDAYMLYRGRRVVVCPETRKYVGVEVDALHAAATAAAEGEAELRLDSCTRWPGRADCDQDCVYQIANAPEDCAVRTMLATFFAGESCAICHKPVELRWDEHKPALLRTYDRRTFECREIPPDTLPFALDTHLPVCWDCHVAESFRREHPDLVTDRDSKVLTHV